MLAGWVLPLVASACSGTGGTTADHALDADAVFSGRLVADLCGGTTVWTPQAAAEVQVLTGVRTPEPGSAGTELPGVPSDTALEFLCRPVPR